jgi:carbon-monoxide dehydrogenase medium subunit
VLLAALGAEVLTMGPAGIRRLPVAELSEGPMTTVLATGELITHVVVPRLGSDERCAYLKFLPKTADDYATVSAGVCRRLDGQTIIEARIFCGSVGPIPVDCAAAELLVGRSSDDENVLAGLAEAVAEVVTPRSDHRGGAEYKREMAGVFVRRSVGRALRRS